MIFHHFYSGSRLGFRIYMCVCVNITTKLHIKNEIKMQLPSANVKIVIILLGETHFCECESNDQVWRHDEGTITDNHLLPVTGLYFSDTNDFGENGFFTLGPLICI